MKRLNYLMNGLAALALIVLFAQCAGNTDKQTTSAPAQAGGLSEMKIAYVEIDTLLAKYNYCIDLNEAMVKKGENVRLTLNQKASELEKQKQEFQTKYQNNAYLSQERAQQDTAAAQQQSENRQYMTQVNQTMDDLKSRLESFTDAVSRGDVVGMRTQADNAFKAIDDLNNLNVPDALKDIQKEYVDGTADLKDALNSYIDLYTEIDSATEEQPFDYSTYDQRIQDIKSKYDEGIGKLQSGDNKASELPE